MLPAQSLRIAAHRAFGTGAIFISLGFGRRLRRKAVAATVTQPPEMPLIRESERNGRPVEQTLIQWSPDMLRQILAEGVDVVRLNLSHGAPEDHERRAREARETAASLGNEVAILADLQGPKIRIAKFAAAPVLLEPGRPFALECDANALPGDVSRVGVSYLNLYKDVKAGDTLMLDDGLIALKVDAIDGTTIRTTVLVGGALSDRKGINRLGGGLSLTALAEKDKLDIRLAANKRPEEKTAVPLPKPYGTSVEYFAAVIRGEIDPRGSESSLETNLIAVEIQDAARESAKTGKKVVLSEGH